MQIGTLYHWCGSISFRTSSIHTFSPSRERRPRKRRLLHLMHFCDRETQKVSFLKCQLPIRVNTVNVTLRGMDNFLHGFGEVCSETFLQPFKRGINMIFASLVEPKIANIYCPIVAESFFARLIETASLRNPPCLLPLL